MEIVSEGSLECISRPASCDNTRVRESAQLKHSSMGFLEELPPEVAPLSFNEEVDSEDDEIISRVESDVFIEDVAGRRTSNDSSVTEQEILEEVINNSGKGTSSSEPVQGHIAQHKLSYAETTSQEPIEMEVQDPKMREGLEKIRKLDNILANKMKREKEVKTQRRQLEKLWRKESKHLDVVREQEGHGKLDLGVGHALALGPPNYEDLSEGVESVPVTPVFPTQPIPDEHDNDSAPTPEQGCNSSSDSRIERETEAVDMDDESSKRTRKKKGSNKGGSKGKTQNFVKRNIELAADAGNVIPMTEAEKKRLEELLSDDTDLLMVENAFTEGLAIPDGQGFTMDSDAMSSLSEIDSKLQDLVPKEEIDLLMSQDNWKLLEQSDTSSQIGTSVKDFDNIGLGERILREEKEMREMKQRLEAIELQLQSLYRENNDESEGLVSEEILAKLIGGSSRTTSRSTTVSESVLSALSSARTVKEPYGEEIQLTLQMSDSCASRSNSKLSLL